MDRYKKLFEQLRKRREGAFVPFIMLGDPSEEDALDIVDQLIASGADALELGIGFSDPVADGPVIMDAHVRVLARGPVFASALEQLKEIRRRHPDIPIGMLTYANMAFGQGPERFYGSLGQAGVDSVLVADCPLREGGPLRDAANAAGIAQIFIASPDCDDATLGQLAKLEDGYIYLVSRAGVTGGGDSGVSADVGSTARRLRELGSVPVLQGFGIRTPEQVSRAIASGVDGVFCGSALVQIVSKHVSEDGSFNKKAALSEMAALAGAMKEATKGVAS